MEFFICQRRIIYIAVASKHDNKSEGTVVLLYCIIQKGCVQLESINA